MPLNTAFGDGCNLRTKRLEVGQRSFEGAPAVCAIAHQARERTGQQSIATDGQEQARELAGRASADHVGVEVSPSRPRRGTALRAGPQTSHPLGEVQELPAALARRCAAWVGETNEGRFEAA